MTEAEQQEHDRLSRSERLTRGKLATMCESVMTRVAELEEIDSPPVKVIAKKLRGVVMSATDFTSANTNHGS